MAIDRDEGLNALFDFTLKALLDKIQSGEATAADFQAARQLLKDCNFDINQLNPPDKVKELVRHLPNLDDDDPSLPKGVPN